MTLTFSGTPFEVDLPSTIFGQHGAANTALKANSEHLVVRYSYLGTNRIS